MGYCFAWIGIGFSVGLVVACWDFIQVDGDLPAWANWVQTWLGTTFLVLGWCLGLRSGLGQHASLGVITYSTLIVGTATAVWLKAAVLISRLSDALGSNLDFFVSCIFWALFGLGVTATYGRLLQQDAVLPLLRKNTWQALWWAPMSGLFGYVIGTFSAKIIGVGAETPMYPLDNWRGFTVITVFALLFVTVVLLASILKKERARIGVEPQPAIGTDGWG